MLKLSTDQFFICGGQTLLINYLVSTARSLVHPVSNFKYLPCLKLQTYCQTAKSQSQTSDECKTTATDQRKLASRWLNKACDKVWKYIRLWVKLLIYDSASEPSQQLTSPMSLSTRRIVNLSLTQKTFFDSIQIWEHFNIDHSKLWRY